MGWHLYLSLADIFLKRQVVLFGCDLPFYQTSHLQSLFYRLIHLQEGEPEQFSVFHSGFDTDTLTYFLLPECLNANVLNVNKKNLLTATRCVSLVCLQLSQQHAGVAARCCLAALSKNLLSVVFLEMVYFLFCSCCSGGEWGRGQLFHLNSQTMWLLWLVGHRIYVFIGFCV